MYIYINAADTHFYFKLSHSQFLCTLFPHTLFNNQQNNVNANLCLVITWSCFHPNDSLMTSFNNKKLWFSTYTNTETCTVFCFQNMHWSQTNCYTHIIINKYCLRSDNPLSCYSHSSPHFSHTHSDTYSSLNWKDCILYNNYMSKITIVHFLSLLNRMKLKYTKADESP
jgi:hypothetical protein